MMLAGDKLLRKLIAISCCFASVLLQAANYELVMLTEYVRHGARATWKDSMKLPLTSLVGVGNITANGMRMHFILGSQLRLNYPTIFNDDFKPKDTQILCSSVNRVIQSAQSHLLGTYPLGTGEDFTLRADSVYGLPPWKGLTMSFVNQSALPQAYRPIPYKITNPEVDYFFFPKMYDLCPTANKSFATEQANLMNKYNYLVEDLSNQLIAAGLNPKVYFNQDKYTIDTIALIYDELKSYLNYYGKLYPGVSPALFDKMFKIANINFQMLFPTEKLTRLVSDAIARDMVEGMERTINGQSKLKFRLYAGHDTGVYSHMMLYNMTDLDCLVDWFVNGTTKRPCEPIPDFASSFIYELVKDTSGNYFVRTLLNGKAVKICDSNTADLYCKFEDFKAAVSSKLYYTDDDKDDFCANTLRINYAKNTRKHTDLYIGIGIASLVLLISLLALVSVYVIQNREYKNSGQGLYNAA